MSNAALFLCAGSGSRMRGAVDDKVLTPLAGQPLFLHSLDAFRSAGIIDRAVIVYRDKAQRERLEAMLSNTDTSGLRLQWSLGGKERQESVFNGLTELSLLVEYVFIHDCARPVIRPGALQALAEAVVEDKAAVLAHRVSDTIKKVRATHRTLRHRHLRDVPRSSLWAMETPQAFARELITDAYRRLRFEGSIVTDDTAAVSQMGHAVTLVENPDPNPKLTTAADLPYLEFLLSEKMKASVSSG